MVRTGQATVGRDFCRLWGQGTLSGLDDGQLLGRFLAGRDEDAFEALVARLGPLVWGVCRRVLSDPHEAEDAFQATFLVLVRKGGSLRDCAQIGPWIHGVARRVARRAGMTAIRRRGREQHGSPIEAAARPGQSPEDCELLGALDAEIGRLPARFREAVVLCCLQGHSYTGAAAQLGCAEGTIKSRIARAKGRLRQRLTARGLALSALSLASVLSTTRATAAVSRQQMERMAHAVVHLAGPNQVSGVGAATSSVFLAERAIAGLRLAQRVRVLLALACLSLFGLGIALVAHELSDEPPPAHAGVPAGVDRARLISALVDPPRNVVAHTGRGSFLVFALDATGRRRLAPVQDRFGNRDYLEEQQDLRWAAVSGTFANGLMLERLAWAFSVNPARANPEYLRVDLQRQCCPPRGEWSAWQPVDRKPTLRLLQNIPEAAGEHTPDALRNEALVDVLPFSPRTRDCWRDVDPPSLRNLPEPNGPPAELLIRVLDFSVEPGWRYRYRARVVVASRLAEQPPRIGQRPPVQPATGPWSEPTGEVLVGGGEE